MQNNDNKNSKNDAKSISGAKGWSGLVSIRAIICWRACWPSAKKSRQAEAAAAAKRDEEKAQLTTVLSDLVNTARNAAKMVADASAVGSSSSAVQ